ncbi:MAG: beta-eliminating lyase-related protein, partial [Steroidobacteraceae bacterium]|nr:beta-eliminating lyase-related protein [Steroidobacteraceae bacterium]MDW8260441.1 beta-eliminating lyase-related protein [Gammaproteobacteria bacterium]
MNFLSDNTAPVAPEILQALESVNEGFAAAYGADVESLRLDAVFSRYFATPVRAFAVATGTAANALALATVTPPYGAVYCHREAHIVRDECNAVEAATGGARLVLLDGDGAMLTPEALQAAVAAHPANVHTPQPAAVSISQATERGRCYRPAALAALCRAAHDLGLRVHMDGARFANAVAFLGCEPADLTVRAGVDVLSFGATKNGALAAEAVVFFDPALVRDFELRRKRAAHLLSKMRYFAAQLTSYIESDVWLRNARRANAFAARLAASAGARLAEPVEANELFLRLDAGEAAALRAAGFRFHDWGAQGSGEYRFVVSWNQSEGDVEALGAALRRLGAESANVRR